MFRMPGTKQGAGHPTDYWEKLDYLCWALTSTLRKARRVPLVPYLFLPFI